MSHWRRTRTISFRVSEREFEVLKRKAEGARNVSEFARDALCADPSGSAIVPGGQPDGHIHQLCDEIQKLNACVRQVADMFEPKQPVVSHRAPLAAVGRKNGRG